MGSSLALADPSPFLPRLGLLHSHSGYSDGNMASSAHRTALDAFRFAEERAGLDFLAVTDHNHGDAGFSLSEFSLLRNDARSADAPGRFVALEGIEWGTLDDNQKGGGHFNTFAPSKLMGWAQGEYEIYVDADAYRRMATISLANPGPLGTLLMANHPEEDDFDGLFEEYVPDFDHAVQLIELLNGPAFSAVTDGSDRPRGDYEPLYLRALALGYHLAPAADQDNHHANWGLTNGQRTIVWTEELTRTALFDALLARRVSATSTPRLQPWLEADGVPMGARSTAGPQPVQIRVQVYGEPSDGAHIELFSGIAGSGEPAQPVAEGAAPSLEHPVDAPTSGQERYVFARIRDGIDTAWTAPIWLSSTPDGQPLPNQSPDFAGLALARPEGHTFFLQWAGARDPELDYPITYDVYVGDGNAQPDLSGPPFLTTRQSTVSLAGLDREGHHSFLVRARDSRGAVDENTVTKVLGRPATSVVPQDAGSGDAPEGDSGGPGELPPDPAAPGDEPAPAESGCSVSPF